MGSVIVNHLGFSFDSYQKGSLLFYVLFGVKQRDCNVCVSKYKLIEMVLMYYSGMIVEFKK